MTRWSALTVFLFQVLREISIHHPLRHQHIVHLYSAFEDDSNIYMVLEFCQLDVSGVLFSFF